VDKLTKKINFLTLLTLFLISTFFLDQKTFASYNPLDCSSFYNGYCDTSGCTSTYGTASSMLDNFCYDVEYKSLDYSGVGGENPPDYATDLGQENQAIFLQMLISSQKFIANVVGFWLPFQTIMIFAVMMIYFILLKLRFFR